MQVSTQEELERTLSSSAESLLICDAGGFIVGANDSVCALMGYDRQELISRPLGEFTESDAHRLISELRDDATLDLETRVRCKDGSTERLQLRLRSLRIEDRPHSMVRVARRRRASDRLPEDPEFIRALLHSAGTLVVCVCSAGRIVLANPAFEALIGIPFAQLRGRKAWDLLPDPEQSAVVRRMIEASQGPRMFECLWPAAGGERQRIAWTLTRLTAGPPGTPYMACIGREIPGCSNPPSRTPEHRPAADAPRREEPDARMGQMIRELEKVRIEHDALAYTLAHDFRAPLRAISGLSDALIDECSQTPIGDAPLTYAVRIAQSAQRMNSMIENLLAFNRISQMPIQMEPQPLDTLLAEVLQSLYQDIRDRGARVTVQVSSFQVLADRTALFLLLFQLVTNALKFVLPDVTPAIVLRAERRKDFIRLFIQDNGIGIAAEYHDVIFGMCERLNPSETFPGTGMGLSIVRKAVERLRGRIGLESQPGKGSCFWVDLLAATQAE